MEIKCFECKSIIEGANADEVIEAFVVHGKTSHEWQYPETAVRNYARNYVEATERLSGDIDRLPAIGEIRVAAVTEERIDDWLQLFDRDGFAGNPDWASCYCLEPHSPSTPDEPERAWRQTRAMMAERLRRGTTFGYLAYAGERTAGWVNASSRIDYGLYRDIDPDGPPPSTVIGVSCFVIAPPFRRHGVASALLDRVIADAGDRGASWIEAYPANNPNPTDAGHFRGPRSMYEARRFEPVAVRERFTVMRRPASTETSSNSSLKR